MLRIFVTGNIRKVLDKKDKIEEQLDVKIDVKGRHIILESRKDAYSEYIAEKVFSALDFGFDLDTAMSLSNQSFMLETIDIKKSVKEQRYRDAIARIIGRKGKTINSFSQLTDCNIAVKDNLVGIIGETLNVSMAVHALNSLVRGAPYSHVVKFIHENKGRIYEAEDIE